MKLELDVISGEDPNVPFGTKDTISIAIWNCHCVTRGSWNQKLLESTCMIVENQNNTDLKFSLSLSFVHLGPF